MLGQRPNPSELTTETWDLIVIGGGITGAGVLLEAARRGKRVLLLEQRDFAWGTSSRSSKMVHGGLRYLGQGDIRLTRHSLLERERLLQELPDMVVRQPYIFPIRRGKFPGRWPMKAILWLYDFLAGIRDHRWLSIEKLIQLVPGL
ncbi:MAG: FAD-dependent oxidoreductase, partial [Alcanivoracaceae bacterium]|nr:FAD-dependent oxidoreductase [Alcanivoracaceae bacterium]